jgi:type I restriction enzyme S subunit
MYLRLALEAPIRHLNQTITGTTVAHLGDAHLKQISIWLPDEQGCRLVRETFEPLSEAIINLKKRSRALHAARDLLLPKLLSGELSLDRIPDPAEVAL